jgi:methyl coenzyme M reductase subunit C-like uncharacterized protein (methanogenesis marker protein 7)
MSRLATNSNPYDTMTKRNIRTPEQIILDTEAKLAKMKERQLRQQAANDPDLLPLLAEKEAIQKDVREAKKILGTGPQSAEARILKHQAWIEKIEIQREEAHDTLGVADQALSEVNSRIQKMIQSKTQNTSN